MGIHEWFVGGGLCFPAVWYRHEVSTYRADNRSPVHDLDLPGWADKYTPDLYDLYDLYDLAHVAG